MTDTNPNSGDHRDVLLEAVNNLDEKTRKIGLYYTGSTIGLNDPEAAERLTTGQSDPQTLMQEGHQILVIAAWNIGDMAFDPSITDPESERISREAQKILPTEAELTAERIRRTLEAGGNIEDIFKDDDGTS